MLTQAGRSVALQPQPARALALLVERAGEVVTRDELRQHLWGDETYLDHDQGINFAVRKIRSALGDDSASARYVETVPRIGYRFVAPVDCLEALDRADVGSMSSSRKTKWPAWAGGLSLLAGILLAFGLLGLRHRDSATFAVGSLNGKEETTVNERYLRGRYLISLSETESIERGVEALEQAVDEEPHLAMAHAALGSGLLKLGARRPALPIAVRVENAARRAIQLDDHLAEGHFVMATARFYFQMDWPGAEREFERAMDLNPVSAEILHGYGLFLVSVGRFEEGISRIRRAVRLDPETIYRTSDLAQVYFWAGRYDESMAQARATLEIDPTDAASHSCLVSSFLRKGERERALDRWNVMFEALNLPTVESLHDAIEGSVRYLSSREVDGRRFDVQLAILFLQQGKDDLAMQRLRHGCRERTQWLVPFIAVEPRLEALRGRSEYRALDCRAPILDS